MKTEMSITESLEIWRHLHFMRSHAETMMAMHPDGKNKQPYFTAEEADLYRKLTAMFAMQCVATIAPIDK